MNSMDLDTWVQLVSAVVGGILTIIIPWAIRIETKLATMTSNTELLQALNEIRVEISKLQRETLDILHKHELKMLKLEKLHGISDDI